MLERPLRIKSCLQPKSTFMGGSISPESLESDLWPKCTRVCSEILKSGQNLILNDGDEEIDRPANIDQVERGFAGYVPGCTGAEVFIDPVRDEVTVRCPNPELAREVLQAVPRRIADKQGEF